MVKRKGLDHMYEQVFETIPVGLFLVDKEHAIYAWNKWMVKNTNIEAKEAVGQQLESLYPEMVSPRLGWALEQVLNYGYPQVLSNILNKFVIPIPLEKRAYQDLAMMQQNVEILPVSYDKKNMALVVIQDVSAKTHLENTLMSMANKFEKSSLIDALTGIPNRRCLWRELEKELITAHREKYNVVCCIYDIDYFKKVNDEYGHAAGDEVLISFAKLATAVLGTNDSIFRYGGEEFITISTHLPIKEASRLPNRLRKNLEAMSNHGTVNKVVTCSGGVAYWRPSDPPITSEMLIEQADKELYKAKESGRNCIVMDGVIQTPVKLK
ncbi:sensor domain-containing diguanylate cyclase [Legionella jamestowniensis]|uniref:diguanylate cyclase n=1 Tax=Legionella jamestowniensis TaxID=455 RepID=A0A0W0UNG3_9GAMM|nr:diguanylate cyclase [Legionella jamestowniensis]KTD09418.1 sensor histidine kinase [Legionella jamestowniensis]OCH99244.1 hypothetical protein A8135_08345 [Legionella jamestowniensis]SFL88946.1 diguanylate cyclase (GGDEF) domain-containing protein [Legionella jamestowniensis DSM 19215]